MEWLIDIWIVDTGAWNGIPMMLMIPIGIWLLGPDLAEMCDNDILIRAVL